MMKKAGIDQLDLSIANKQGGEENAKRNESRRKFNWIGHILPRNCLLKHY
jgi:hypothetical protein